ncbi:hypothetical protein [Cellulomonas hominis]|uniref:hypothetical protein n=1 Tax=Cellulomonas hominis TaxID=156981 RepID=UPI001B99A8C9|nr:hypothetical protein [Cellulomonas hominis]VTR77677.1 hypothetical protein CHMI_02449 [Cellulomonas hominis]
MTTEITRSTWHAWSPEDELQAAVGPLPCVARPHAGLVHRDGPCRCFVGGPAPEHAGGRYDAVLRSASQLPE